MVLRSVVDEDVQTTEVVGRRADQTARGIRGPKVCLDERGVQLVANGCSSFRRAAAEHETGALCGKPSGSCCSDPARGAGDDRHLTVKSTRHDTGKRCAGRRRTARMSLCRICNLPLGRVQTGNIPMRLVEKSLAYQGFAQHGRCFRIIPIAARRGAGSKPRSRRHSTRHYEHPSPLCVDSGDYVRREDEPTLAIPGAPDEATWDRVEDLSSREPPEHQMHEPAWLIVVAAVGHRTTP